MLQHSRSLLIKPNKLSLTFTIQIYDISTMLNA